MYQNYGSVSLRTKYCHFTSILSARPPPEALILTYNLVVAALLHSAFSDEVKRSDKFTSTANV
jgi:hypothetical protein